MEMTQQDFDERMDRRDAGQATDEDTRLIELYQNEGYVRQPQQEQATDGRGVQFETSASAEVVPGEQADEKSGAKPPRKTSNR